MLRDTCLSKVAEFKLRAERRAGQLLSDVALRGGDHVSANHHLRTTLEELDHNQSAGGNWRPKHQKTFNHFLLATRERHGDITTAVLILANKLTKNNTTFEQSRSSAAQLTAIEPHAPTSPMHDLMPQILGYRTTIEGILSPIFDSPTHRAYHLHP